MCTFRRWSLCIALLLFGTSGPGAGAGAATSSIPSEFGAAISPNHRQSRGSTDSEGGGEPGREPQLEWIELANDLKGAIQQRVFGADTSGFYVYQSNGRDRLIEKYTFNGRRKFSHALPFQDRSVEVVELLARQQDVLVFFSIYNPTYSRHGLFVQRYPLAGGAIPEPAMLLDRSEVNSPTRSEFHVSPDQRSQGFVVIHLHHNEPLESQLFVAAFGGEQQKLNETTFRVPVESERPVIEDLQRDTADQVLALVRQEGKTRRRSQPEGTDTGSDTLWRLWSLHPERLSFTKQAVTFPGYDVPELSMAVDRLNGGVRITGLLLNPGESTPVAAGMIQYASEGLLVANTVVVKLESAFLQSLSQIRGNLREKLQTPYRMLPPLLRSDGGWVLMAEAVYQTTQTYVQYSQGFPVYREITRFHTDEMVLLSVNAGGGISWRQIIPKKQVSSQPTAMHSAARMAFGSNIHLLYNDEGSQRSRLVMQSLRHQGDVENRTLHDPLLGELILVPADACQLSPATLLVPAQRRKKPGVLRVTIPAV